MHNLVLKHVSKDIVVPVSIFYICNILWIQKTLDKNE